MQSALPTHRPRVPGHSSFWARAISRGLSSEPGCSLASGPDLCAADHGQDLIALFPALVRRALRPSADLSRLPREGRHMCNGRGASALAWSQFSCAPLTHR
jgi:hypothetical protein